MNELEETQVERQLLLGDPPVRAQPRPQQRPKAFDRVDMDLMEPVAIVITGVFPRGMTHRVMCVTPLGQPAIDIEFSRVNNSALRNRLLDPGTDRDLLHVLQHPDHDRAGALEHPEDGGLLLGQRLSTTLPFQPAASAGAPFFSRPRDDPYVLLPHRLRHIPPHR